MFSYRCGRELNDGENILLAMWNVCRKDARKAHSQPLQPKEELHNIFGEGFVMKQ